MSLVAAHIVGTEAAGAVGNPTLEATYTSVNHGWEKVERWSDPDPGFTSEVFPFDGRGNQTAERLTYFGGDPQPDSDTFLFYYAPDWDSNPREVPVLLVLGATQNVDQAWANPSLNGPGGCGVSSCPTTGLMQLLVASGYKVFAVNFAHSFGDNYMQAQIISDAIEIIRESLDVPKVDVIAWSKGVLAARMYVSSVKPAWGRSYASDVRKLILLGGPNKGLDTPYRHGIQNMGLVWPECGGTLNFPIAAEVLYCFGAYYAHPEYSYSGTGSADAFPGGRQSLYRWDSVYPLDTSWADWYTVYYGGWGYYSYSRGVNVAIAQGSVIATMRAAPTPVLVTAYLLCGGWPTIPTSTENTGPSDGVVFVASCADTGGLTTVGGNTTLWYDNHVMLGWENNAVNKIKLWLN
jgi:hypothetical protein